MGFTVVETDDLDELLEAKFDRRIARYREDLRAQSFASRFGREMGPRALPYLLAELATW